MSGPRFVMPVPRPLGTSGNEPVRQLLVSERSHQADQLGKTGSHRPLPGEYIFGYRLPEWQRPAVWTGTQRRRFIESCYLSLDIGRFVFTSSSQPELDRLIVDGQQRLRALSAYFQGEFAVFGARWTELDDGEQRKFFRLSLPVTTVDADRQSPASLLDLYERMNYGGTPHTAEHHPAALHADVDRGGAALTRHRLQAVCDALGVPLASAGPLTVQTLCAVVDRLSRPGPGKAALLLRDAGGQTHVLHGDE